MTAIRLFFWHPSLKTQCHYAPFLSKGRFMALANSLILLKNTTNVVQRYQEMRSAKPRDCNPA